MIKSSVQLILESTYLIEEAGVWPQPTRERKKEITSTRMGDGRLLSHFPRTPLPAGKAPSRRRHFGRAITRPARLFPGVGPFAAARCGTEQEGPRL